MNIEAAHIIDEAEGGSNKIENGIPLCFDCHQEVGAYNNKHPRGNKFRPEELRARRDEAYKRVAAGEFVPVTLDTLSAPVSPNPIHRIVDLLSNYHAIFLQLHHADSNSARLDHLENWRACHPIIWEGTNVRDDAIRRLADPAKEWLAKTGSSFVTSEDLDRVEEGASALSAFAISSPPMAMPCIYSKKHSSMEELEERWEEQSDQLMALGSLISRLKEIAARSGQKWTGARE